MASSELADLTEATTLASTDLLYTVVDPAGTPLDRKATVATLRTSIGDLEAAPARSGNIYRSRAQANSGFSTTSFSRLYAKSIVLSAGTLDRIGINHNATTAAGEVMRLGIYLDDAGRPGALLLDAGTVDLSTAVGNKLITINQAITTGIYWLAAVKQGPTNTASVLCYVSAGQTGSHGVGGWTDVTGLSNYYDSNNYYGINSVTGALPNPIGAVTSTNGSDVPMVVVRYA